jgi:hypothetical protein
MISTKKVTTQVVDEITVGDNTYKKEQLLNGLNRSSPEKIGNFIAYRIRNDKLENLLEDLLVEIANA